MTTWEQVNEDRFILREHNCPILRVAQQFDHPCRCEIDLLKDTLQADVKRIGHIPDGDIACVYQIDELSNGDFEESTGDCLESDDESADTA
jgi:predicted ArsR family transcriptional regulator